MTEPHWRQQLIEAVTREIEALPDEAGTEEAGGAPAGPGAEPAGPGAEPAGPGAEPAGPGAEPGPDLYTLMSELTALRQEVRVAGRDGRRAIEALTGAREHLDQMFGAGRAAFSQALDVCERAHARAGEADQRLSAQEATADGWRIRALLGPFLDLRDALMRAAAHVQAGRTRRWWQRADAAQGADRTLVALLGHLDDGLHQASVTAFPAVGDAFDPRTMVAVGRQSAESSAAIDTVASVARGGFRCGDHLLRRAEVLVFVAPHTTRPKS